MKSIVHFVCLIMTGIGVANAQIAPVTIHLNKKEVDVGEDRTIIELVRSASTPQQVKIFYDTYRMKRDCVGYADSAPTWVPRSCEASGPCVPGYYTTTEYCNEYSDPYRVNLVKSVVLNFKKAKKLVSQETEKFFLSITPSAAIDGFDFFGVDSLQYERSVEGGTFLKKLSVEFKYKPKVLPHILPQTIAVLQGDNKKPGSFFTMFKQENGNINIYRIYRCYPNCPYLYLPLAKVVEFTPFLEKRYERISNMSREVLKSKFLTTLKTIKFKNHEPLTSEENASLGLPELSKLEMFEALKEQKELLTYVAKHGSDASTDYRLKQLESMIHRSELKASAIKKVMVEIDTFMGRFDSPDLEVVTSGIIKELIDDPTF